MNGFLIRLLANALALLLIDQLCARYGAYGLSVCLERSFSVGTCKCRPASVFEYFGSANQLSDHGLVFFGYKRSAAFHSFARWCGGSASLSALLSLVAILLSLFSTILNLVLKN